MRRLGFRSEVLVVLLLTLAASGTIGTTAAQATPQVPGPLVVRFRGEPVALTGAVSIARLLEHVGAQPQTGRLLSVAGRVLNPAADPPRFFRNGVGAEGSTMLETGDDADYTDGTDRTEAEVLLTFPAPGGNPERAMGPANVAVRRGLLSGDEMPAQAPAPGPRPRVALTFDDGPHPRFTPAVLDVLRAEGVKATFFPIGANAARHPGLVRRALAEGHSVANHSWGHPRLAPRPGPFVAGQLGGTRGLLRSLGARVTLFRPPYGVADPDTVRIASDLGMRTVLWSVDSRDWRKPGTAAIVRGVVDRVRPGSIVLMHDAGGDRSQTVAALPQIIRELRARGYELVALG